jgi:hypothetical protein
MELAPVSLYVPATHPRHCLFVASSCMYSPGPQYSHLYAPALLKPAGPHGVQVSVAPVL